MAPILVTGAAGFVGFHLAQRLLAEGHSVLGVDSITDYYDVGLKQARLALLSADDRFEFSRLDIAEKGALQALTQARGVTQIVHLAGQAGVRYAQTNPHAYVNDNVLGFVNVVEAARQSHTRHLVYASSSSVYGDNTKLPFSEDDPVDHPVSLYAATKRSSELIAHAYAHMYGIACTGLRFFSVYGPWGRPDMAYYSFARAIVERRPIRLFNYGRHQRDMTYIDDVIDAVVRLLDLPPQAGLNTADSPARSKAPFRIYNVGSATPVPVLRLVELLQSGLGVPAVTELVGQQTGDVLDTAADTASLFAAVGYAPRTTIETGIARFLEWFRAYHKV